MFEASVWTMEDRITEEEGNSGCSETLTMGEKVNCTLKVPEGTTAVVTLPGAEPVTAGPGVFQEEV